MNIINKVRSDMKKMKILKKYNLYANFQIQIFQPEEINSLIRENIPSSWVDVLCEKDDDVKIGKIIKMWEKIVPSELSITITYLKEHLQDIDLIKLGKQYYLLYSIVSQNEKILFYVGGNPLDSKFKDMQLPESICMFYEKLHNGFYEYRSKAMGLVESENVTCFGDDEWGILEQLESALQINMDTTYGFFENGMGGYIAMDTSSNTAVVWFSDDQPIYNISFWDFVDEWITIGMQE